MATHLPDPYKKRYGALVDFAQNDGAPVELRLYMRDVFEQLYQETCFAMKVFDTADPLHVRKWYAARAVFTYATQVANIESQTFVRRAKSYKDAKPVELLSATRLTTNPYATLFHLNRRWTFAEVDAEALRRGWMCTDTTTRWEECLLYEVRQHLEAYGSDTDDTAMRFELLSHVALQSLQSEDSARLIEVLDCLVKTGRVCTCKARNGCIYVTNEKWHSLEGAIHDLILYNKEIMTKEDAINKATSAFEGEGLETSDEQRAAVANILMHRFSMVSAKPGTGKTNAALRIGIKALQSEGYSIVVCVPTHAAKDPIIAAMHITKRGIFTLHKFVHQFNFASLENSKGKLAIMLDEMGMMDSDIFGLLCVKLRDSGFHDNLWNKMVLLGDHRQCPPVGRGCPFEDLMHAKALPSTTFTKVYRASDGSLTDFAEFFDNERDDADRRPLNMADVTDERFPAIQKEMCSVSDIPGTIERVFRSLDVKNSIVFTMTAQNNDCVEYANHIRSVVRPMDHRDRVTFTTETCKVLDDDEYQGRAINRKERPVFAPNDPVFFTSNTRWYNNGDCTIVLRAVADRGVYVHLTLDYKTHALMCQVLMWQQNGDSRADTYTLPMDCAHESTCAPDEVDDVPTLGFDTIEEELKDSNCELSDFANRTEQVRALRSTYKWKVCVSANALKPVMCTTTYKAQGAQCDVGVSVIKTSKYIASRQVYTQLTRSRKRHIIIGPANVWQSYELQAPEQRRTTVLRCMLDDVSSMGGAETSARFCKLVQSKIPSVFRDEVWKKHAGNCLKSLCYCCGTEVDVRAFHVAHILARYHGGELTLENTCVSCASCNVMAGTRNFDEFKSAFTHTVDNTDFHEEIINVIRQNRLSKAPKGIHTLHKDIEQTTSHKNENVRIAIAHLLRSGRITKETLNPQEFRSYATYAVIPQT